MRSFQVIIFTKIKLHTLTRFHQQYISNTSDQYLFFGITLPDFAKPYSHSSVWGDESLKEKFNGNREAIFAEEKKVSVFVQTNQQQPLQEYYLVFLIIISRRSTGPLLREGL